jgi:Domain of unknown function (DUF1905)
VSERISLVFGSSGGEESARRPRYGEGVAESLSYEFRAPLWVWEVRRDLWTFVTLPDHASDEILARVDTGARGFGAVPVRASIGTTTWRTSIFPKSADGPYDLPVKRAVRDANGLGPGDIATVRVEVLA